jgi:mono/diheme cytochrome c family protein
MGALMNARVLLSRLLVVTIPVVALGVARPAVHRAVRPVPPRVAERTVWDSVYSAPQAARGESLYTKSCARCHQASLSGADESPALTGGGFLGNWNGLPLSDLQTRIRTTMPTDTVGIYDRQLVTDVIAYVLRMNNFPAGSTDLPIDTEPLRQITIRSAKP